MDGYMTVKEAAEKWGISVRRVQILLKGDRIPGAERIGEKIWVIPSSSEKPNDNRVKSGKYIGDWAKYHPKDTPKE